MIVNNIYINKDKYTIVPENKAVFEINSLFSYTIDRADLDPPKLDYNFTRNQFHALVSWTGATCSRT